MEYVNLGNTGLKVSRLCLGTMGFGTSQWRPWVMNDDTSTPVVQAAVERGINFIDFADFYSMGVSEEVVGRALRHTARHKLVMASKCFYAMSDDINDSGLSRKHIMDAVDNSLKRIGTESRHELEALLGGKVFLEIWVKVRSGWADDETRVRSFGYE